MSGAAGVRQFGCSRCMAAEIEFLLWLLSKFDKFSEHGQK